MAFSVQDLFYAAPIESLNILGSPKLIEVISQDPTRFEAPLDFVTMQEVHKGTNGRLIIHIQDAHSNLSGQQNLAGALDEIMSKYGVSLVLSEGGVDDCSLTPIKKIAPPDVWKRVAKNYLIQGKLSGEEYLNLVSDHPMKILGLEDAALYLKSIQNYAELTDKRGEILEYLKTIQRSLDKLKQKMYPGELIRYELIRHSESRRMMGRRISKTRSFADAQDDKLDFEALLELAATKNIDLSEFPNVMKLIELELEEKLIDFNIANVEQAALAEEIEKAGGGESLQEFLKKAAQMKNSKASQLAYFQNTFRIAKDKRILLTKYPNLTAYGKYLEDFSELDLDEVLDELERAEDKVYTVILRSPNGDEESQKRDPSATASPQDDGSATSPQDDSLLIRSIDRYLNLLETAYHIQMTTKEFDLFRANEPDFATVPFLAFINRKLAELAFFEDMIPYKDMLERGKEALEAFYDSVAQRDVAFVRNAEKALESEKQDVAVLITGGYHTSHLKKLLRGKGYSVAVLTPIVTSETNQAKYEKLLLAPVRKEIKVVETVQGAGPTTTGGARVAEIRTEALMMPGNAQASRLAGLVEAAGGNPENVSNLFGFPDRKTAGDRPERAVLAARRGARVAAVKTTDVFVPEYSRHKEAVLEKMGTLLRELPGDADKIYAAISEWAQKYEKESEENITVGTVQAFVEKKYSDRALAPYQGFTVQNVLAVLLPLIPIAVFSGYGVPTLFENKVLDLTVNQAFALSAIPAVLGLLNTLRKMRSLHRIGSQFQEDIVRPAEERDETLREEFFSYLRSATAGSRAAERVPTQCVTGDTLLPVVRQEAEKIGDRGSKMKDKAKHGSSILDLQSSIQLVPIKEVKAGDYVLSLNEETQTIESHRINGLLDMGIKPVYKLTTAGGRSIRTTANHPYLVRIRHSEAPCSLAPKNLKNEILRSSRRPQDDARGQDDALKHRTQDDRSSRWIKVSELKPGDEIGVAGSVSSFSAHASYFGVGQNTSNPTQKQETQSRRLSFPFSVSFFSRVDYDAENSQDYEHDTQRHPKPRREVLEKVTRQTHGKYRLIQISQEFGNEFLASLIQRFHDNPNYSTLSIGWIGRLFEKPAYATSSSPVLWDPIVSIDPLGFEQVWDIEVEGTHNFIGNGIFAHNTYLPPQATEAIPAGSRLGPAFATRQSEGGQAKRSGPLLGVESAPRGLVLRSPTESGVVGARAAEMGSKRSWIDEDRRQIAEENSPDTINEAIKLLEGRIDEYSSKIYGQIVSDYNQKHRPNQIGNATAPDIKKWVDRFIASNLNLQWIAMHPLSLESPVLGRLPVGEATVKSILNGVLAELRQIEKMQRVAGARVAEMTDHDIEDLWEEIQSEYILYHGTSTKTIDSIKQYGLDPARKPFDLDEVDFFESVHMKALGEESPLPNRHRSGIFYLTTNKQNALDYAQNGPEVIALMLSQIPEIISTRRLSPDENQRLKAIEKKYQEWMSGHQAVVIKIKGAALQDSALPLFQNKGNFIAEAKRVRGAYRREEGSYLSKSEFKEMILGVEAQVKNISADKILADETTAGARAANKVSELAGARVGVFEPADNADRPHSLLAAGSRLANKVFTDIQALRDSAEEYKFFKRMVAGVIALPAVKRRLSKEITPLYLANANALFRIEVGKNSVRIFFYNHTLSLERAFDVLEIPMSEIQDIQAAPPLVPTSRAPQTELLSQAEGASREEAQIAKIALKAGNDAIQTPRFMDMFNTTDAVYHLIPLRDRLRGMKATQRGLYVGLLERQFALYRRLRDSGEYPVMENVYFGFSFSGFSSQEAASLKRRFVSDALPLGVPVRFSYHGDARGTSIARIRHAYKQATGMPMPAGQKIGFAPIEARRGSRQFFVLPTAGEIVFATLIARVDVNKTTLSELRAAFDRLMKMLVKKVEGAEALTLEHVGALQSFDERLVDLYVDLAIKAIEKLDFEQALLYVRYALEAVGAAA